MNELSLYLMPVLRERIRDNLHAEAGAVTSDLLDLPDDIEAEKDWPANIKQFFQKITDQINNNPITIRPDAGDIQMYSQDAAKMVLSVWIGLLHSATKDHLEVLLNGYLLPLEMSEENRRAFHQCANNLACSMGDVYAALRNLRSALVTFDYQQINLPDNLILSYTQDGIKNFMVSRTD